jgi:Ca2+-binding EF-hand superfamily protein
MKPVSYVIATLFVGLTVVTSAQAGDPPRQRPTFEQLDKNSDGKIVASEVPARGWQRLSRADTNKDNAVTKAEFDALRASPGAGGPGKARPTFEQLDKNSDGKIVASEVPAWGWQRLSRADTNKDNAVTKAEFDALRASRPGRAGQGRR